MQLFKETAEGSELWAKWIAASYEEGQFRKQKNELLAEIADTRTKGKSDPEKSSVLARRAQRQLDEIQEKLVRQVDVAAEFKHEFDTSASEYVRSEVEPALHKQRIEALRELVPLVEAAVVANAAVARIEMEMRTHQIELPDGSMVYSDLLPGQVVKNAVIIPGQRAFDCSTVHTFFSLWMLRMRALGILGHAEPVDESGNAVPTFGDISAPANFAAGMTYHDRTVHQPAVEAFESLSDRFRRFVERFA